MTTSHDHDGLALSMLAEAVASTLAHGFGGPLNVMTGRLQLLRLAKDDAARDRHLDSLDAQVKQLAHQLTLTRSACTASTALVDAGTAPFSEGVEPMRAAGHELEGDALHNLARAPQLLRLLARWWGRQVSPPARLHCELSDREAPARVTAMGPHARLVLVGSPPLRRAPWLETEGRPVSTQAVAGAMCHQLIRHAGGWSEENGELVEVYWPRQG